MKGGPRDYTCIGFNSGDRVGLHQSCNMYCPLTLRIGQRNSLCVLHLASLCSQSCRTSVFKICTETTSCTNCHNNYY